MTTLNIPGNLIRWRFVLLAEAKLASSRVLRLCHVVFTYPSPRPVGGCKGEGILFCVLSPSHLLLHFLPRLPSSTPSALFLSSLLSSLPRLPPISYSASFLSSLPLLSPSPLILCSLSTLILRLPGARSVILLTSAL